MSTGSNDDDDDADGDIPVTPDLPSVNDHSSREANTTIQSEVADVGRSRYGNVIADGSNNHDVGNEIPVLDSLSVSEYGPSIDSKATLGHKNASQENSTHVSNTISLLKSIGVISSLESTGVASSDSQLFRERLEAEKKRPASDGSSLKTPRPPDPDSIPPLSFTHCNDDDADRDISVTPFLPSAHVRSSSGAAPFANDCNQPWIDAVADDGPPSGKVLADCSDHRVVDDQVSVSDALSASENGRLVNSKITFGLMDTLQEHESSAKLDTASIPFDTTHNQESTEAASSVSQLVHAGLAETSRPVNDGPPDPNSLPMPPLSPSVALPHQPGAFRVRPGSATRISSTQQPGTCGARPLPLPRLAAPLSIEESIAASTNEAVDEVVFSGILAVTVDQRNDAPLPALDPNIPKATEVRLDQVGSAWLPRRTIVGLIFFVLCVAAAIATGALVSDTNRTSPFDEFMSSSSWYIDTRPIAANDPNSAQARALSWLERDLRHNSTLEPWRIRQRYSLAVFYFSLNGAGWLNNTGWLSPSHECSWFNMDVTCDESNRFVVLAFDANNLRGTLPPDLGYLTDLRYLQLYDNHLSGPIPTTIASLVQLEVLLLSGNVLSGPIPTQIGLLTSLGSLALAWNRLSGRIPSFLAGLSNLIDLYCDENILRGTIPTEIGQLRSVQYLRLDGNFLCGTVPTEIGLMQLVEGSVHNNLLNGTIPTEIGLIASLRVFDFSDNSFTGTIPSAL
jgi:hypothetical protein